LASAVPNELAKRAGERYDAHGVRLWLGVGILFGVALLVVRVLEFAALNVRWDSNAYGSVVWTLLGFHTVHLATDWADSVVLAVAAVSLLLCIVFTLLARSAGARVRFGAGDDSAEPPATRHFLAIVAAAVGLLSALVIFGMWIGGWVLSPCFS